MSLMTTSPDNRSTRIHFICGIYQIINTILQNVPYFKLKETPLNRKCVPYFFGYKTELFFFQNNLKDLDPSCKTDLDLLDCLGRVNLEL